MKIIALYNLKGGVGKTSLAVNLACLSASLSRRRTLLWDLDLQGAATHILQGKPSKKGTAASVFARDVDMGKLVRPTRIDGLELIAADLSLRGIDRLLFELGGRKRLAKLFKGLGDEYDRVILDCAPGLNEMSDQILRNADIVIVPVVPSPLSRRAFEQVATELKRTKGKGALLLPVHSMVDRRRTLHRKALEENPDWPIIPVSSAVEQMADRHAAVHEYAASNPAARAIRQLWTVIERKIG